MILSLTKQQQLAVAGEHHTCVDACPGSGKTRAVIVKLLQCLRNVQDTVRQVACITYTNAGVDEVSARLRKQFGRADIERSLELRTIHSFCIVKILRPFSWLLEELRSDFQVVAWDDPRCQMIIEEVIKEFNLDKKAIQAFQSLRRSSSLPFRVSREAAHAYWQKMQAQNILDFDGVIHFSAKLCEKFPFISAGLATNFKYFIVDEFQDTTSDQLSILTAIAAHRLSQFFFVGDPNQSIMRFAGAFPEAMNIFRKSLGEVETHVFTANFRSSSPIVDSAEQLLRRTSGMHAAGKYKSFSISPRWIHSADLADSIKQHFVSKLTTLSIPLSEAVILAPNFYILSDLARELRNVGVPVRGFGAYPYRRTNHIVAPFLEIIGKQASNFQPHRFGAAQLRLAELVELCGGRHAEISRTFLGRIVLTRILLAFQHAHLSEMPADDFLKSLEEILCTELARYSILSPSGMNLLRSAIDDLCTEIRGHFQKSKIEFTLSNIGFFGITEDSLRLLTIHKSKGREFEAVAIVKPHEGLIPFGSSVKSGSAEEADGQRLMYVGVTRAKRILMHFTDSNEDRRHSRYVDWMKLLQE